MMPSFRTLRVHCGLMAAFVLGQFPCDAGVARAEPADGCPRTAYLSTGDHQDLLWVPLDSAASVDTMFATLRDRYQVSRVWWRGGQDEIWANQFAFRFENRQYEKIWAWWRHLAFEKVGTNKRAIESARRRGLKIWMAYGLFDNGSAADVGFSGFPYAAEDKLRIKHPDSVPQNRWGTWTQGGPIEFASAPARKGMVEYLAKHILDAGYDGVAFLTYAENFSQRYDDEFGFGPALVDEFRKRHGVDPRTEPYDKAALAALRGEYLTQFFRELRDALKPGGPRIGVCVDGLDPELPARWSHNNVRTAGVIKMDVATWAKEGLVDEVDVWAPPDDEAKSLQRCRELVKGTQTVAGAFRTRGQLPPGTPRMMFLGADIESGFDWENHVNYHDEKIPPQPVEALDGDDPYARRRVLTAVLKKKQTLPAAARAKLPELTKDKDLYVRRLALRCLAMPDGAAGDSAKPVDPAILMAVKDALRDDEHSVRLEAALTLGELAGAAALSDILDAIERDPVSHQMKFHALPEVLKKRNEAGKLTAADKAPLVARLGDPKIELREAVLHAFLRVGAPATSEVETVLAKIVRDDASPYAREMALANMASSFGLSAATLDAVHIAMRDKDDAVQVRAAGILAKLHRSSDTEAAKRTKAMSEVEALFRRYGKDSRRADRDWGWRVAGDALRSFGKEGDAKLEAIRDDKSDLVLAEKAWRVLHVPQGDAYLPTTLEADRATQAKHPRAAR